MTALSLRARLFLTSMVIVAGTVAALLALGTTRLLAFEQRRMDERGCLEVRRIARRAVSAEELAQMSHDITQKLGLAPTTALALHQEPAGGGGAPLAWGPALEWLDPAWRWEPVALPERPGRRPGGRRPAPPDDESRRAEGRGDDDRAAPPPQPGVACVAATIEVAGEAWRAVRFRTPEADGYLAVPRAAARGGLDDALRSAAAWVLPLAALLTAVCAALLSMVMMRPLNRLRDSMSKVNRSALDQRLPGEREPRELRELIDAYNAMLDRLEASFNQASRFSADAAHELKTPLTILRGRIEEAVRQSGRRAIQADLAAMLEEVGRLSSITRKLLLLSQADAGTMALHRTEVDVGAVLSELVADAQMMAPDRTVNAHLEAGLRLNADDVLLRQALGNLVGNAVRHGREGGWIELNAGHRPGGLEIVIANDTEPVGAARRARLFDRFYRGEPGERRSPDGHGLGLSLAREIVRAHGGELALEPSPDREIRLKLWLPQA